MIPSLFIRTKMTPHTYTTCQLAADLGFKSAQELRSFAQKSNGMYRWYKRLKDKEHPENGTRIITPPSKELKAVQRALLEKVLYLIKTPDIMGGGRGSSTKNIMKVHVGKPMILCYDISNFFPSVSYVDVKSALRDRGFSRDVANIITRLVTLNGHLPQGAPCSTQIAKLILMKPAAHLIRLLKAFGKSVNITFWVDDIIISGPASLKNIETSGHNNVYNIFSRYGLTLKKCKTRVCPASAEQEALGIRVDHNSLEPCSGFMKKYHDEVKSNGRDSKKARGMRSYIDFINKP